MPDIFLSYAHVDKHWVDTFAPLLEQRINQYIGRASRDRVWKDNRFTANQPSSHETQQQLNNARCLVACFSVGYFASDWCMRELNEFTRRVGEQSGQIFCIELDELVLRQRPPIAGKMLGYPFWRFDSYSRRSYPLYPNEKAYEHLLTDVSKDIAAVLRADVTTEMQQQAMQHKFEAAGIAQENILQVDGAGKRLIGEGRVATLSALQARQQRLKILIRKLHEQCDFETRVEEQVRIKRIIQEKEYSLTHVENEIIRCRHAG